MKGLYALLLYFFPRAYREEYSAELQAVFDLSFDDAMESGGLEVARVALHELSSLPKAIVHEHLRVRRRAKMIGKFSSRFDFAPGSGWEFLSAFYPFFLLGGVLPIINMISMSGVMRFPNPLFNGIAIVLLAVLGILCLIGLAKGLPRWSLPYLGLPLPIACILIFNALLDPKWPGFDLPWLASVILMEGFLWSWMILVAIVLVLVSAWIPRFRPFYLRLRQDWTLLSFLLYGAAPLTLFITLDDYKNVEPFFFLSLLMLTLGGWFYLRNDEPLNRFVSLHIGLALAMLTAAVGKAVMFKESWPQIYDLTWKNEMIYTLVTWVWLASIMLLPLLLNLLPRPNNPPKVV